jgi:hypothetical protein
MARLNHGIFFSFLTSPGANDGVVRFEVSAGQSGTPEARVYLDGGAAPAYTVMVPNFFVPFSYTKGALAPGTYVVEYKDANGERIVGKVILPIDPEPCALGATISPTGSVVVTDTNVRVKLPYSATEASIDDGTNYKTISSDIAQWSNSELAALGITDKLVGVRYRKTSITNVLSINSFQDPGDPDWPGMGFTRANMSDTTGLSVGMTIPFFGSNLYGSGTIVELSPGSFIVFQHSFVGSESGVTTGTLSTCNYKFIEEFLLEQILSPLVVNYTVDNVTTNGGNDGNIHLLPSGGSGNYGYLWGDGATIQNRIGIIAATYTVTITDLTTAETVELEITVTEPDPAPSVAGSLLRFSLLNSIHMLVPQTPDNCSIFQTLDNTLFCNQVHPYYEKTHYYQKVCKCDGVLQQFDSDFSSHIAELYNYVTGALVKSLNVELKEENLGQSEDFNITIRNHTTIGQSRIYFNVGALPIPLQVGDAFTILNNLDGFNGNYTIVDIITDTLLGYQYLVINKNYNIVALTSAAVGRFVSSTADFNVYEFTGSLLDVPNGKYYLQLRAFDDLGNTKVGVSEPIDLQVEHPNTQHIEYRNNDNAFDTTWTTGFIGRIRVEGVLFKRLPGGERSMSRNSDYSLVKVNAKKQRIVLFETYHLPPYLHEKLSVIFDLDFFKVNGVEYQASEGYGEPQYLTRWFLSNSSIKLEQVGWFARYNSDDIGSVAEGGFMMTETGFLKR